MHSVHDMSLNGLIRSQLLSISLTLWSTRTLKKNPIHQVRPNTKRTARRGRNITLMIDSRLVQSWKRHSNLLSINSDVLHNIVNGRVAPNEVNVKDAVLIGENLETTYTKTHMCWWRQYRILSTELTGWKQIEPNIHKDGYYGTESLLLTTG